MQQGRVSIVIPTYDDDPKFLAEAVASARAQTHPDIEIVIVDDGSSRRETLEWLRHLGDAIKVVRQQNGGPGSARNSGIAMSSGEVVICLDADDRLSANYAAEALQVLNDTDAVAAVPLVLEFGDSDNVWGGAGADLSEIAARSISVASGFRKVDWERVGRIDASLRVGHEDWEFWVRLIARTGGRAIAMPSAVHHYRVRYGSRSRTWSYRDTINNTRARYLAWADEDTLRALLVAAWRERDRLAAEMTRYRDDKYSARHWLQRARKVPRRIRRAVRSRR
ncbi:glycosyltransferase family 2 protein [Ornithinimicrobium sp. W1665]|uniref:glycosyltransferase family 2 protein n=1 Tax=Ornithinimicrobium sp. W1665 TaxID=3416666 RepID=UPI003CF23556